MKKFKDSYKKLKQTMLIHKIKQTKPTANNKNGKILEDKKREK